MAIKSKDIEHKGYKQEDFPKDALDALSSKINLKKDTLIGFVNSSIENGFASRSNLLEWIAGVTAKTVPIHEHPIEFLNVIDNAMMLALYGNCSKIGVGSNRKLLTQAADFSNGWLAELGVKIFLQNAGIPLELDHSRNQSEKHQGSDFFYEGVPLGFGAKSTTSFASMWYEQRVSSVLKSPNQLFIKTLSEKDDNLDHWLLNNLKTSNEIRRAILKKEKNPLRFFDAEKLPKIYIYIVSHLKYEEQKHSFFDYSGRKAIKNFKIYRAQGVLDNSVIEEIAKKEGVGRDNVKFNVINDFSNARKSPIFVSDLPSTECSAEHIVKIFMEKLDSIKAS